MAPFLEPDGRLLSRLHLPNQALEPWRKYFDRPDVQEALKASGGATDITEVSERIELPS
jgi:hypothetical protein